MEMFADALLCLFALALILAMVSLISGILITALKIIIPIGVLLFGFWLSIWAEDNLKRSRAQN